MSRPQPVVIRRDAVFAGVLGDRVTVTEEGELVAAYRYRLERQIEPAMDSTDGTVLFIMLNPSKADEWIDDPTIRRDLGFTAAWGYTRMVVANLYALRSTDPDELRKHPSPCGPANDGYIASAAMEAALIVCAWGADVMAPPRALVVTEMLKDLPLWCLGVTKDGQPKHPLYLRADAVLQPFNDAAARTLAVTL